MPSIKKNLIYNLLLSVSQILFPLISFPYASRKLGPGGIGTVSFVDSFTQYFILIAALGIPIYGVREVARARSDRTSLNKLFSELLIIHFVSTFFLLIAYACLVFFVPQLHEYVKIFFVGGCILTGNVFLIEWFFVGMENFGYVVRRTLFFRLVTLILLFVFVHSAEDTVLYYGLTLISVVASALINMWYSRNFVSITFTNLQLKRHLKPLLIILSSTAIISVYVIMDNIILGFLTNNIIVGYYTISTRVSRISVSIIGALGTVLIPRLSALYKDNNKAEMQKLLNMACEYVMIIGIPVAIGMILLAPELILLFGGTAYTPAIPSLRILSLVIVVIGLAQIYSQQILIPFNREKDILISAVAGVIISLLLNLMLIPLFKHIGSALASLATEITVTTVLIYFSRKRLSVPIGWRSVFTSLLSCVPFYPIKLVVSATSLSAFPRLLLIIVASGILYMLLQLFLFRNRLLEESISPLKQSLENKWTWFTGKRNKN